MYSILPNIIIYIVSGFIFISTFKYIRYVQYEKTNNFITESLIIGFVLHTMVSTLFVEGKVNILFLIIFSIVSAYFSAKVIDTHIFHKLMKLLKINRTPNKYIWDDILDNENNIWIEIFDNENKIFYIGITAVVEDYTRQPLIVLSRYSLYDEYGELIKSYKDNATKRILIDTSKFKIINIIYNENSKIIKNTKNAIDK